MPVETITTQGLTLLSFPILCATAIIFLSWVIATYAPTQMRKLQSSSGILRLMKSIVIPDPKKKKVYDIVELRVYPIKSCRGISIRKSEMQMHGLDLDRQWMFVDNETREFVTIRQNSRMTLINTRISEDGLNLVISVAGEQQQVSVPAYPNREWLEANTTLADVQIWSDRTDGYMYGSEVSQVFSRFLEQDVRLVYKGPRDRVLRTNATPELLGRVQSTFFADQMPLLIASEESISELNQRLTQKGQEGITVERFRPNIIIKGNQPWSEDSWQTVQIQSPSSSPSSGTAARGRDDKTTTATTATNENPLVIDVVARCARCQVPNVEPNTAEKHKREPWDTLVSYRRVDSGSRFKPCFGMHCVPRNEGRIEVGMQLEVLLETDKHRIVD